MSKFSMKWMAASLLAILLGHVQTVLADSTASLPTLTPRELAVAQLVNASRILALQGIAEETVGHVSIRDPSSNDTFLVTAGTDTPWQISPGDIAVVRLNDSVLVDTALSGIGNASTLVLPPQVFLHAAIYQRFPSTVVGSVAYFRPEQMLFWSMYSDQDISKAYVTSDGSPSNSTTWPYSFLPAFQPASFLGPYPAPVFDVFTTDANVTSTSIDNLTKAEALATQFGPANTTADTVANQDGYRPLVFLRNDGVVCTGTTVTEVVFRLVNAQKNARILTHLYSLSAASGSVSKSPPNFVPPQAVQVATESDYLKLWIYWLGQINSGVVADEAAAPANWKEPY